MKKSKLLTSVAALSLALSLGACTSSSDIDIANDDLSNTNVEDRLIEEKYDNDDNLDSAILEATQEECDHIFSEEYEIDSENSRYHTRECTLCGYIERQPHQVKTEAGDCIYCDATGLNTGKNTVGLHYRLDSATQTYNVYSYTDMNRAGYTDLYIPAVYNNHPVVAIGDVDGSTSNVCFGASKSTNNYLEFVSIPDSVEVINPYAFYRCYSLQIVYIGSGCVTISERAFDGCYALKDLIIDDGLETIGSYSFHECYSINDLSLPSSLKTISDHAFMYDYSISEINIPDGVETVGRSAFEYCEGATSLTIPGSVKDIDEYAFAVMPSLTSLTLQEGIETIGACAFWEEYSLPYVHIPSSVKSIGNGSFMDCTALISVSLEEGVESLGEGAFWGCWSLRSINLPSTINSLGWAAFDDCFSLYNINIPEGVTYLDAWMFAYNYAMDYIVLPTTLTYVDDCAFWLCYSLKDVYYAGSYSQLNMSVISSNDFFLNASWHYYSETYDAGSWHYVNGEPTVW